MIKRVSLTLGYVENDDRSAASSDNDESSTNSSNDLTTFESVESQVYLNAPVVWERTTTGYRIVDLRADRINSALDLINSHFFLEEPICSVTSLSKDAASLKFYRRYLRKNLLQGNSFCAIREGEGSLVGLAVMSMCRKTNDENRDIQGAAPLTVVMTLVKHLFAETQLENKLADLEEYFRMDVLCVKPEHRGKGVATGLLRSCVTKTRSLNVSACIGLLSSDTSQRIAGRLSFEKLGEIPYVTYIAENNQENPFADIGTGNHSLACMAVRTFLETRSTLQDSQDSTNITEKLKKTLIILNGDNKNIDRI